MRRAITSCCAPAAARKRKIAYHVLEVRDNILAIRTHTDPSVLICTQFRKDASSPGTIEMPGRAMFSDNLPASFQAATAHRRRGLRFGATAFSTAGHSKGRRALSGSRRSPQRAVVG
jgi:hypothetical protein